VARYPLDDVPEGVARLQYLVAAPGRLVVLRAVLDGPTNFTELVTKLDLTGTSVRNALDELETHGWLTASSERVDEPGRRRKRNTTYTADREVIMGDLGAFLAYLGR